MSNHYKGLTEEEVVASRRKFGSNILTPPQKESGWERLMTVFRHPISQIMAALTILALVFTILYAFGWQPLQLENVPLIPSVMAVATIVIILIGYLGGFNDPLFKILISAFILSMGISLYEYEYDNEPFSTFYDSLGIVVALFLATGVSYVLEKKNEKVFQSLNEVNDETLVKVIRNDNVTQVERKNIVVGDVVLLETGEEVPADCLLLDSLNLIVNESSLTGELQTTKTTNPERFNKEATYPSNHILKGTVINDGFCTAEVIRVGDATEAGKVFVAAQVREGKTTPLTFKLNRLSKWITWISAIIAVLILIGRIIVYADNNDIVFSLSDDGLRFIKYLLQTVMIAVTLIVVAVPEGLPMSVSLSLAFSMRKLMRENTLPRTMHACETMGATSVICTDKTGTLTQNSMSVVDFKHEDLPPLLIQQLIALNSTANIDFSDEKQYKVVGNPTEGALLELLYDLGINYQIIREQSEIIDRLPFSTENKYMASIITEDDKNSKLLLVKGAPEILMSISDLDIRKRKEYTELLESYQKKGMRTLALAYKHLSESDVHFVDGKLSWKHLSFAGIVAIADPVRTDVPEAIGNCLKAGIDVKIVTGDNAKTAAEIGKEVGLLDEVEQETVIMTGTQFEQASDEELKNRISTLKILSRARPQDKERLVRLLRKNGEVVAVTGDGTNDAPALNAADVGLSMGDGTAVAKEASDMTILDNSFHTISDAVMWGRSLYKNIQRFIMYQMTINLIACIIVLVGAFMGTESPLTVPQMLWVNLIMDTFAAIALASLPPDNSVMSEKPRKVNESIVSKKMLANIFITGGVMTVVLFIMLLRLEHADVLSFKDLFFTKYGAYDGLSRYEQALFFTSFVMLQYWNMFNAKAFMTGKTAFANFKSSRGFTSIALIIFLGQVFIVQLGYDMFNVAPLKIVDWIIIVSASSIILLGEEMLRIFNKLIYR